MAKRRRLTPVSSEPYEDAPSAPGSGPFGFAGSGARPPVAQVAGDAAARAAVEEMAQSIAAARDEGRLATPVPLAAVDDDHLVRDRIVIDEDEMSALLESLRERGQQTPIEVVALKGDRFGLISGWRRVTALRRLGRETVLAVIRRPASAAESYRAMVEENEIRAGLSFWERANVAAAASDLGLYSDARSAVAGLFANASAAKRSKIASFVRLHEAFAASLRFPAAIPERTGLALAAALDRPGFAAKLRDALRKAAPETAEAERAILDRALRKADSAKASAAKAAGTELAPGVVLAVGRGRATLSGPGVDTAFLEDLSDWLARR